ncbi:protein arginine N-methyltransferase 3-like [Mya arenaria]|uniref:protein arginine N-methyltransferase 3-like n=1 Tax=Mya arenaria TaxID=6604 RepID=UPI0022E02EC3|nr:protein arginine N-methyltransferase 3-like [Mya arenaria]
MASKEGWLEEEDVDDDDDVCLGDDDAWEEEDVPAQPARCLFCREEKPSAEEIFSHCVLHHSFDIHQMSHDWSLDCFGYIKMINYIRAKNPTPASLKRTSPTTEPPWAADMYMQPVDPEDTLLQFDIEDLDESSFPAPPVAMATKTTGVSHPTHTMNGGDVPLVAMETSDLVSLTTNQYEALLQRLKSAEERSKQSEENLQRALEDMDSIREKTRELVLSQPSEECPSASRISDGQTDIEDDDDPYFSSYGHFSIHEEMLKDRVRTESYRDCMYKNKDVFRDKIVLDVGCGTGILSMFAAQAGAQHVYAVDMAEIIYQAMDIARENNLEDKITFIRGKLEDITLPVGKVDIIISEWMGYFLLFESMLDSVLYARNKYLKPGGVVYPDRCNISVAAISDLDLHNKHVTYWDDVYGFKMNCMKTCVVREASVDVINKDKLATTACIVKELDVCTCSVGDLQFTAPFNISVTKETSISAFIGYFDIFFHQNCTEKVEFSTGPGATPTHWKQSVFLLDTPMQCHTGDEIKGTLSCRKNRRDPRSLIITFSFNGKTLTYYME